MTIANLYRNQVQIKHNLDLLNRLQMKDLHLPLAKKLQLLSKIEIYSLLTPNRDLVSDRVNQGPTLPWVFLNLPCTNRRISPSNRQINRVLNSTVPACVCQELVNLPRPPNEQTRLQKIESVRISPNFRRWGRNFSSANLLETRKWCKISWGRAWGEQAAWLNTIRLCSRKRVSTRHFRPWTQVWRPSGLQLANQRTQVRQEQVKRRL